MNCQEIGFIAIKPKSIACRPISLFNYLPINAFRLIYGVSIICHQKLESIFIFVTENLVFFFRASPVLTGKIYWLYWLETKKNACQNCCILYSLLIYRRLHSLPVARDVSRNSTLVGEERRGTAVFAGYFGSITNRFSGSAPPPLSRTGCCNLLNIFKQFLNCFVVALFSPSASEKGK